VRIPGTNVRLSFGEGTPAGDGPSAANVPVDTPPAREPAMGVKVRNYVAAEVSRLMSSWTRVPISGEEATRDRLTTLRARMREQVRNNPYFRRFDQLMVSNVIGPHGIGFQSAVLEDTPPAPRGQQDQLAIPEQDQVACAAIEDAWKRWSDECDMGGRLHWTEYEKLAMRTVVGDGEIPVQMVMGRQANSFGFALHAHDPDLMDVKLERYPGQKVGKFQLEPTHSIIQGVEVNEWRRPMAYWFKDFPRGPKMGYQVERGHIRVPATDLVHLFMTEFVGQVRGVPWGATSLNAAAELDAYFEAAVTHARVGANQLGFFTRTPGMDGFTGTKQDGSGNIVVELSPGEWNELPPGVDIKSHTPQYPASEFNPFVTLCLRRISAGLGPAYIQLAQDSGDTNFAGSRQAILEEREFYKGVQAWVINGLHRPIFKNWLRQALANRQIRHPRTGQPLPFDRIDKYERAGWFARRWTWVDPLKDAQAMELMRENRWRSDSQIIRDLGADPGSTWDEIQRDQREQDNRGIVPQAPPAAPPGTSLEDNDDQED